jgi:flagellar biosynthesis component FlhA
MPRSEVNSLSPMLKLLMNVSVILAVGAVVSPTPDMITVLLTSLLVAPAWVCGWWCGKGMRRPR